MDPNLINKLNRSFNCEKQTTSKRATERQNAFNILKQEPASKPLDKDYCLKKEVVVTTDASKNAISVVLSQEGRPVVYKSRRLSATELRYSNIERGTMNIVYAISCSPHFLLVRKVKPITDLDTRSFFRNE